MDDSERLLKPSKEKAPLEKQNSIPNCPLNPHRVRKRPRIVCKGDYIRKLEVGPFCILDDVAELRSPLPTPRSPLVKTMSVEG